MADAGTALASTATNAEEPVDIDLNDPQVGEAAKKIQSAFRIKKKTTAAPTGDTKNATSPPGTGQ